MPTINFELRNRPDKNGLCQIRIVLRDRSKRVFKPLDVRVLKTQWDMSAQKVVNHPQAKMINDLLRLRMADLQGAMAVSSIRGEVSIEKVIGRDISKTSFHQFAGDCLHAWEKTKAPASIRAYSSMLAKVREFDREIAVEDISPDWLARYEAHSRKDCGDGGTLKRIAFVSVILKEAIRRGKISRDPFMIYKKPPKKNPPKVWLTVDELAAVEEVARITQADPVRNTTYWFLLACYTGLRYSDIEKFNPKKMVQDGRLILYTQKTGEVVSIKITQKIMQLISIVQKLPPIYTNQKANQYLKAIAHLAGIDKLLTFHTARHTFAVQCANLGISQEVTAKLLGHSDLKTTSLYYKIINVRIDDEMRKWDK